MRALPVICCVISLGVCVETHAGSRYLTWIDDTGKVHNTVVNRQFVAHEQASDKQVDLSDQARFSDAKSDWPGTKVSGESKRRYYTWVDARGTLQNSFYAGGQLQAGASEVVLGTGESSSEYIDSDVLEGRGYQRDGDDGQYYTWVDEHGRMRNSTRAPRVSSGVSARVGRVEFTEGRQIEFAAKPALLPDLDGHSNDALNALLSGSKLKGDGLYRELIDRCCTQMKDDDFTELSSDEPRFEELNRFSPRFDFPMGRSYYAAIKLPKARSGYGLRVRSFANKQVVYPSLLFLDGQKRPTRLVSDAVYKLHAETWYRFAFIEGTVQIKAAAGEGYVLLLTTEEDKSLKTLDNKPFKRPLQAVVVDEAGMQAHEHSEVGSFELAVIR